MKCTDKIETSTSHPLLGKAGAFKLLKTGSFKFQPPRAEIVFKCPTLSSDLSAKWPSQRFLLSVIKLMYIRDVRRDYLNLDGGYAVHYRNKY